MKSSFSLSYPSLVFFMFANLLFLLLLLIYILFYYFYLYIFIWALKPSTDISLISLRCEVGCAAHDLYLLLFLLLLLHLFTDLWIETPPRFEMCALRYM